MRCPRDCQKYGSILVVVFSLFGCASVSPVQNSVSPGGFFHKVESSQTLWSISRMYNVDINDLAGANRITNDSRIQAGQLLLVPSAFRQQPVSLANSAGLDEFIWPLRGKVISYFNLSAGSAVNKGIDIRPGSDFNVQASRWGRVVFSTEKFSGYGKTVIIDHNDGFSTVYAGLLSVSVKPGDEVSRGQVIALAASAGNSPFHFEIRKGHQAKNPFFYLPN